MSNWGIDIPLYTLNLLPAKSENSEIRIKFCDVFAQVSNIKCILFKCSNNCIKLSGFGFTKVGSYTEKIMRNITCQ